MTQIKEKKYRRMLRSPVTMVFSLALIIGLCASGGVAFHAFADGDPVTYWLTYEPASGEVPADTITFTDPGPVDQPDAPPTLTSDIPTTNVPGYRFEKWQIGDTLYDPGATPDTSLFTDDGSGVMTATATAVWKKYITVTFLDNQLNTTNAPKNVPAGESFRLPNPSQSGYKFTGWNTSADGSGTNYNGNANVSGFTEDTTLYARWNKKYGINYIIVDTNGTQLSTGSKSMEVPFDSDETVFPLPALTQNGYTFKEYRFQGEVLSGSEIPLSVFTYLNSNTFYPPNKDPFYAVFEENTYIIHRTVNSPPGATCTSGEFPTDTTVTLKFSDVYTGGYTDLPTLTVATGSGEGASPVTFSGWDLRDADGNYTFVSSANGGNEQKTKFSWRCFSDASGGPVIDLYMTDVWKVYYVVHFDSNGGSAVADKKSASPERYTTVGEYIYSDPTKPTWKGYTFLGWSKTKLGSELTTNHVPKTEFTWNASMTYLEINRYAHWEKRCRLLYYDGTTKKYTDENLNIPADETTGLYDTYDFIPNKTLTKAGYFFKGWSLENGSDVLVSSINSSAFTELNNDTFVMNVYAVWETKTYTVTWDLNDGDFVHGAEVLTHPDPLSVTLTQADVDAMTGDYQLGTASATGYKFLKWKTTYDDGSSEELNASTTENQYIAKSWFNRSRTGLFAAKAQWQAQYTLAFDANAGGDTVTGMPVDHERTVTEAVNSNSGYGAFSATVPSRNGYTFMGWALDPAGNEMITGKTVSNSFYVRKDAFTTPIADPPSFEATLYAIWAKNVTVTFDYNGGVLSSDGTTTILQKNGNTAETIRVAENQHLGDPAFEWTGHTFVKKWNTEPDGSGTEYTAGDNVIFSDDTTLYAMWQAKFRLTYQPNAEGVDGMPQFGYNESTFRLSEVETASISIREGQNNGPKMRGYVFKGWSLTADGSQMVQNGYEPLGSVPLKNNFTWDATNNYYAGTVYAIWAILEYQIQLESGLPDGVTFSGIPNNLPDDHILTFTYEQIKDGYQAHDLTAAGYQFLGWNVPNKTTSNGLEPDVEGSDYVTIDDSYIVGRAQPVVLTAQWNKLYSVHYDANLGAHGALTTSTATPGDELVQRRRPADLEYVFTPSTIIRDDNYKRGDDTDNDGTIDQTYTFMGWSLSDDNDVSKKITNIPDSDFTQATVDSATNRHSFTIYAIWKANVILTYHAQGGYFTDNGGDTLIVDSKAIQTTGPSQWDVGTHWNSHTLLGWNTKPDGSGKYYISWKVNSSDSVKNVNMLHTPNEGVWSTNDSGTATFTESTDLYAQWARNYRVVYHTNNPTKPYDERYLMGGNSEFSFPLNYNEGTALKKGINDLPTSYTDKFGTNTNYYFMGWTWDPATEDVIDDLEIDEEGKVITYLAVNDLEPGVDPADAHFKLTNTSSNVWKYVGDVYAVWSPNPYTVRFADGVRSSDADITRPRAGTVSGLPGSLSPSNQGAPSWNDTTNTYDVTLSYFEAASGYSVPANMLSARGYNFKGWGLSYTKKNGDTVSGGGYGNTSNFAVKVGTLKNSSDSSVTLTGRWEPVKHNVTYQQDDGGAIRTNYNVPYESSVTVGDGVTTQIIKPGKTFIGWQLIYDETDPEADQDALGTTIGHYYDFDPDDGSTPSYTFAMPDRDLLFRAVYSKDSYTVTYQAGEGVGTDKVFDGIGYKVRHTVWNNQDGDNDHFTRTGYAFDGWTVEPTRYARVPGNQITVRDDITYTAKWKVLSYPVSYYQENGTTKITDKSYVYHTDATVGEEVTAPAVTGKTFDHWQLVTDDANALTKDAENHAIPNSGTFLMPAGTVKFKAVYRLQTFPVTYYEADGTTKITEENRAYGSLVTVGTKTDSSHVTATVPDGYEFAEWVLLSGNATVSGGQFTMPAEGVSFKAVLIRQYLLRYDKGSVSAASHMPVNQVYSFGVVRMNDAMLDTQCPTAEGCEFVGWTIANGSDSATYSVSDLQSSDVSRRKIRGTLFDDVTHEAAAVAQWQPLARYTVSYAAQDENGASLPLTDAIYQDRTYNGWKLRSGSVTVTAGGFTMPDGNVAFEADYTEHTYTVVYMDGGTLLGTQTASYTALKATGGMVISQDDPAKERFTFKCWCLTDADTTPAFRKGDTVDFSRFGTELTATLYAQWTPLPTFTVSYTAYDSDHHAITLDETTYAAKSYYAGDTVTVAPKLSKTSDSTFIGWVYNDMLAYNGGQTFTMPSEDMVLVGRYIRDSELQMCDITYMSGVSRGADGWNQGLGDNHTFPAQQGTEHIIKKNDDADIGYLRENYEFLGWNITFFTSSGGASPQEFSAARLSGAGNGDSIWDMQIKSFMVYRNVTLTAVWNATLTYDANGGSGTVPSPQTCRSGDSVTVADGSGLIRDGYTFAGWNPESTASVSKHAPGSSIVLYENTTLYAVWIKNGTNVTLTYDANGGSGTVPAAKSYPVGTSVTVASGNGLSRKNAAFVCWNTDPQRSGKDYRPGDSIVMTGNQTLYAIWKPVSTGNSPYYSLTYDANGATSGTAPTDATHYAGGEKVTVAARGNLSRTGCTFVEWNTRRDGTGTGYRDGVDVLTMPKADVILYAVWKDPDGNTVYDSPHTGEDWLPTWFALGAAVFSAFVLISAVIFVRQRERLNP